MSQKMGPPQKKIYNFNANLDNSWQIELNEFYNDILKKRSPIPGLKDAYENLKIINKIYKKKK